MIGFSETIFLIQTRLAGKGRNSGGGHESLLAFGNAFAVRA
jgi:hypothetical protein